MNFLNSGSLNKSKKITGAFQSINQVNKNFRVNVRILSAFRIILARSLFFGFYREFM